MVVKNVTVELKIMDLEGMKIFVKDMIRMLKKIKKYLPHEIQLELLEVIKKYEN